MNSNLNPNYTKMLTIEEFKEELQQCRGSLDEKLALFRN